MTIDKLDKCFESFLSHLANELSDKIKGTPFLCRTDEFFRINKMKRFYNNIKKVLLFSLNKYCKRGVKD